MKKIVGFVGLALWSIVVIAQEVDMQEIDSLTSEIVATDTLLLDSIDEPPPYLLGVYFFGEGQVGPHYGGYNLAATVGIGVQYERWMAEFSVTDFSGVNQEFLIFPRTFLLDYRYAGPSINYQLAKQEWFSIYTGASFFMGDMLWQEIFPAETIQRDEISILNLSAQLNLEKLRYIKPYVRFGYQRTNDLDLSLVNSSDFTGLVFVFGIQIGYFNQ